MGVAGELAAVIPITNPLNRLKDQILRRADDVGTFPNENVITRPIGATTTNM